MRGIGGNGDNGPALLATELAHRLLEQVKRAADVDGESLLPCLQTQLIGRAHAQNPRGVNQHIQPIDAFQQMPAHLGHLLRIGNIQVWVANG